MPASAPGVVVLLPPSEGKAPGGEGPGWNPASGRFGAELGFARTQVAMALAETGGGDERLLSARGALLERARAANRALLGGPCLPAWQRFTGVVWDNLDVATLTPTGRARATEGLIVISAAAGAAGIDDPLPDHRLKLTARLAPLGHLAAHWRPTLTTTLRAHLAGRTVIDLLPAEHAAAFAPDPNDCDLYEVRIVDQHGRSAGHHAKAAKGRLARAVLEATDPLHALHHWNQNGHHLDIRHR